VGTDRLPRASPLYAFAFLFLVACQITPTVPAGPWDATAVQYRGQNGRQFAHTCPSNGMLGAAYGTDIYTDDSSICTAAVHAGLITPEAGGTVTVEIRPGQRSYPSTFRNNVTSNSWGQWVGSFAFAGPTAVQAMPTRPAPPTVSTAVVSDVDRVPTLKTATKKHAYAVVIGIEQYREKLPKADFADRDAKLVGEYLTKVMGYPEENVIVRTNDKAAKTDLEKYLDEWLRNNVEADGSVFVYYSGHGAPNVKNGEAYLVPYDGDPSFVESTGFPLKRLYAALDKLPAREVTVVLDSCFSGAGGRSVLGKGLRPMGLSLEQAMQVGGKTMVLAASAGDQVSSSYEEKGHGLLTYYFLKGLQGEGDADGDGNIDMAELFTYLKPNVQRTARKQNNVEQTPQLLTGSELLKRGSSRLVERAKP